MPLMPERMTVARTRAEVEALRAHWDRLPVTSLDADIDWLLTVVDVRPEAQRPHVAALERPDGRTILVVARLEELALESRIGYLTVAKPTVRCLFVVRGGVVGAEHDEDRRAVLAALRGFMAAGEADVVVLADLRVDDGLFALARDEMPWARRDHVPQPAPRRTADIPGSYDEFLRARSRNTRENVKRYGKRLLKAHGDTLDVRLYTREDELDEVCSRLEAVAAKTYQRGLGVAFSGSAQDRALLRLGMRNDWFRAWVLSIDGAPVAFWHGFRYRGTFGTFSPGFDPAFADLRIGTYLQMRMIETLCEDPDVRLLDFGSGDAQYKRSYSDHCVEEASVLLFARTPRAIRVNLARTSIGLAARAAKRVADETELGEKLKRVWRERLAARGD
jgi:CelD/BcsL family acetyltransferase involved in cellulose biosynthesis